jgi:hypothetical protein
MARVTEPTDCTEAHKRAWFFGGSMYGPLTKQRGSDEECDLMKVDYHIASSAGGSQKRYYSTLISYWTVPAPETSEFAL